MKNTFIGFFVGFLLGICMMAQALKEDQKTASKEPLSGPQPKPTIDYQIALLGDTIWVYDSNKYIGCVIDNNHEGPLFDLINEDIMGINP